MVQSMRVTKLVHSGIIVIVALLLLLAAQCATGLAAGESMALLIVGIDDSDKTLMDEEKEIKSALIEEYRLAGLSKDVLKVFSFHFNKDNEREYCSLAPLSLKREDLPFIGIVKIRDADFVVTEVSHRFRKVAKGQGHDIIDRVLSVLALPRKGSLVVDTTPPGADVFVDGKKLGTTPLNVQDVEWGTVQVAIRKKFYAEVTLSTAITPGKASRVSQELAKSPAGLVIAYADRQKDVFNELQEIYQRFSAANTGGGADLASQLPLIALQSDKKVLSDLGIGEADLPALAVVTHRDRTPLDTVWVKRNVGNSSAAMEEAMKSARDFLGRAVRAPETTVDVVTEPQEAAIVIDGKIVSQMPLINHPLPYGEHTLEIQKENFITEAPQKFTLALGDRKAFRIKLKPMPIGILVATRGSDEVAGRLRKVYGRYQETNGAVVSGESLPFMSLMTDDGGGRKIAEALKIAEKKMPVVAVVTRTGRTPERCLWTADGVSDPSTAMRDAMAFIERHLKTGIAVPPTLIDVVAEPRDANISVDGKSVSSRPLYNFEVRYGAHVVEVTKENCTPWRKEISLEIGEHAVLSGIALSPVPVGIAVACDDSGSNGSVGYFLEKFYRKFLDVNPKTLSKETLPVYLLKTNTGEGKAKAKQLGIGDGRYPALAVVARAGDGSPERSLWSAASVTDPTAAIQKAMEVVGGHLGVTIEQPVSRVDIITNVPDATLILDGRITLRSPVIGYELSSGVHQLEMRKEKYLAQKVDIIVEYGDYKRHIFTLAEEKGTLKVMVASEDGEAVKSAQLIIDGEQALALEGPEGAVDVPTGSHNVQVKREGYEDFAEKVDVEGGKTRTLSITLKRKVLTILCQLSATGELIMQNKRAISEIEVNEDDMRKLVKEKFRKYPFVKLVSENDTYEKLDFILKVNLEATKELCTVLFDLKPIVSRKGMPLPEPVEKEKAVPTNTPFATLSPVANEILEELITEAVPEVAAFLKSYSK